MPAAPTASDTRALAAELAPRVARLNTMLRRRTALTGLSFSQLTTLAGLRDFGSQRVTDLAAAHQLSQPSMTVLVIRMERLGWVRRVPDTGDGRAVNVTITPVGRQVLARVSTARAEVLAERLAVLSPAQREALAAALPAVDALIES
jgi:DNA-binding MarR family transcriptional regulator